MVKVPEFSISKGCRPEKIANSKQKVPRMVYYNSEATSIPRDLVWHVDRLCVRQPFAWDETPEEISMAWLHILFMGWEGLRADRVGADLIITGSRRAGFVGGHA